LIPNGTTTLARFRLRFLLQEIDLPQGDTVIGRSASCQVTIEDPMVSREHARIRIREGRATIEDLGSRNGVQVGGSTLRGVLELKDGDRIRIGTQEMVFCAGDVIPARGSSGGRSTGFMVTCAECGHPYPAEMVECPACGSSDRIQEDTLIGESVVSRDWALELVVEAMQKAESLGKLDEVERILSHARLGIDQRLANNQTVERASLDGVAETTITVARARGDIALGSWLLSVYAQLGLVPPAAVVRWVSGLSRSERLVLVPAARRVLESVSQRGGPRPEDKESFERIQALLSGE
jgi:hypothetical protein